MSLQSVQSPDMKQSPNEEKKKIKKKNKKKKTYPSLLVAMDSKSWLTYQLESMKKATQEEVLENILFPDFSKSRSLSAY